MQYKKGQWLERVESNSGCFTQGKYYKVMGVYRGGVGIADDGGNHIVLTRDYINEHFKPAPKTWQTLEVGDVVIDEDGDEMTVLEVLDNSFLLSDYSDRDEAYYWLTFKKAKEVGCKIKGAEEADIEELTMEEVCKELGRTIKIKK